MEAKSIERIAEELGVSFHALQPYILMRAEISFKAGEQQGIQLVVDFIEKEFGYFTNNGLAKIIIDDDGYYGSEGSIAKYQAFLKERVK